MIKHRFEKMLDQRCTLLGVGPMSANCIDATIELANDYEICMMLIASRRQIDSAKFGGGYVNNWTTEQFAQYVIDHDKKGKIFLARDHGGPWQNSIEKEQKLSLRRAMESAKESYRADIEAGFQIIHIDTSVDIYGQPNVDEALERLYELYEFCWSCAQHLDRKILFEIGTEEQSGSTDREEELEYTLHSVNMFCRNNKLPLPMFVVVQAGTRVLETSNVGSFDSPVRVADEIPPEIQIPKMIDLCRKYNIFMKAHNTDYLSNEALQWYPRLGIHAANVAPEFGVAETKALVSVLENNGLFELAERFLDVSYKSGKWEKWMMKDTKATARERAIIAGHYVFAKPEVIAIKEEATRELQSHGVALEQYLKEEVKLSILRYIKNFRLVRCNV